MKVLLINPPTTNAMKTNESFFTMRSVNFFPPINLMYPATTLKQRTNHTVKIMDADIEGKNYEEIEKEIKEEKPDIVGVTTYTLTFYDCLETIRAAKRAAPHAKIFVGGPLTKHFQKELLEYHPEIDYIFLGDAEYSLPELVTAIEKNTPIENVKGIIYRKDGQIITTGPPNVINNLDELPFPDLSLIDHMKYYFAMGNSNPVAIIIGSRGCPYQCGFCLSANSGYRMRSITSMLDEIKYYMDHGIKEFTFYDDTFNITAQRVIDFSKGILERGYKITWSFRGRIDNVTEEMFKVAKEAGLILMCYGVEDATDEGLERIKRRQTLKQIFKGTELAKKYKIPISMNFIMGLPQHKTEEDILRVIKLAKKLKPDYCQFSVFIPFLGTTFYKEGIERGILDPDFWTTYVKAPYKDAYIPFWEEHLKKGDLAKLVKKAHLSFYFDPRYIVQALRNVTSFKDLYVKIGVGINLFRLFVIKSYPISPNKEEK